MSGSWHTARNQSSRRLIPPDCVSVGWGEIYAGWEVSSIKPGGTGFPCLRRLANRFVSSKICRPGLSRNLVLDGSKAGFGRLDRRRPVRGACIRSGNDSKPEADDCRISLPWPPQLHGGFAFACSLCSGPEARLCAPQAGRTSAPFFLCVTATSFAAPWRKLCCANAFEQSPDRPAIGVASAGLTEQPQERADSRSRAIAGELACRSKRTSHSG